MVPRKLYKKRLPRFNRRKRYWTWYLQNKREQRLGGDFGIYQTLGSISNANPNQEYISRKVAPEGFTGPINVTSGNGLIALNGEGNWSTSIVLEEGDYYQAKATSSSEVETSIILTVDVPDSFTITTRALDITPNPFTFTDQTDVEPSTVTTSLPVVITGMDPACPVSVVDGEYDINQSGSWTAAAGTIDSGDEVRVRRTSGGVDSTVGVEFTAGTVSDTFDISVRSADITPNPFPFTDVTDATANTLITSDPVTVTGMDDGCPTSVVDGEYDINQSGVWLTGTSSINEDDQIRLRRYSGGDPVLNPDGSVMIGPDGQPVSTSIVSATMTVGTVSEVFTISVDEQPGTGLPTQELIGSYDGVMSADGSKVLAVENRGNESQLLPTVIAGDGTGYVAVGPITYSADFAFTFNISLSAIPTYARMTGVADGALWNNQISIVGVSQIELTNSTVSDSALIDLDADLALNTAYEVSVSRVSGVCSISVNEVVQAATGTLTGDFVLTDFFAAKTQRLDDALVWNISIDGHNFIPGEAGSDTVWDTVTGLSYEGTGFTGAAIVEKTDGSGSGYVNENGYTIADGATMYTTAAASVLVPEGTIVPAGCGFTSGGQPYPTEYPGPLAADMEVRNMSCLEGDGTGYVRKHGVLPEIQLNKLSFDCYLHTRIDKDTASMQPIALVRDASTKTYEGVVFGSWTSSLTNEIVTVATNDVGRSAWVSTSGSIEVGGHQIEIIWDDANSNQQIWVDGTRVDNATDDTQTRLVLHDVSFLAQTNGTWVDASLGFKISNVRLYDTNDDLCSYWPCQDGVPGDTEVRYIKNVVMADRAADLITDSFVGSAFGSRDMGFNYLPMGYSKDQPYGANLWTGTVTVGTGWTDDGNDTYTCDNGSSSLYIISAYTHNTVVNIVFTITNYGGGTLTPRNSGAYGDPVSSNGTFTQQFLGGTESLCGFTPVGFTGTLEVGDIQYIEKGFWCADYNNPGYDIDGNPLEYLEGEWDAFQNMGVDVLGPFAAEAQALIEFTAGQEFDFGGAPFNTSDYIFNGTTGGAIYSEAQDQTEIDQIIDAIGDGT